MAATYFNTDALLKTVYDTTIHDLVVSRGDVWGSVKKTYRGDGEEFETVHRVSGTGALGFMDEDDTLFSADRQKYKNGKVYPMEMWGAIELSQKSISTSKTSSGAYRKMLDSEIVNFGKDWRNRMEIVFMGDGNAIIAKIAATGTNTLTLKTEITEGFSTAIDPRKFTEGGQVEVWSSRIAGATQRIFATGATNTLLTVSDDGIDLDTAIITFDEDPDDTGNTIAVNDYIAFAKGRQAGTLAKKPGGGANHNGRLTMMGLGFIDDKDTPMETTRGFMDILAPKDFGDNAQTGTAKWASKVNSNGGVLRALDTRIMQKAKDAVRVRSNGKIDRFISPFGPRLEFAEGQQQIRRSVNEAKISGPTMAGFHEDFDADDYIVFGNCMIIPNRYMRPHTVFGTTWSDIEVKFWDRAQWWTPPDSRGSILRRDPNLKSRFRADHFMVLELCVGERAAHYRIEDVDGTEPA